MKAASAASSLERRSRRDTNSRPDVRVSSCERSMDATAARLKPEAGGALPRYPMIQSGGLFLLLIGSGVVGATLLASDGFVNEQVFFLGLGAAVPFTLVALVDGTLKIAVGTWMFLTKREHAVVDMASNHL